jgi:hypothetical protein
LETGKAVLRDYINATVGFEKLARATGTPAKGAEGKPARQQSVGCARQAATSCRCAPGGRLGWAMRS